jgi:hypothetical protein
VQREGLGVFRTCHHARPDSVLAVEVGPSCRDPNCSANDWAAVLRILSADREAAKQNANHCAIVTRSQLDCIPLLLDMWNKPQGNVVRIDNENKPLSRNWSRDAIGLSFTNFSLRTGDRLNS